MLYRTLKRIPHARGDEPTYTGVSAVNFHVYPTHVGMNRTTRRNLKLPASIPHARGDEPAHTRAHCASVDVYPTHVGMNRTDRSTATAVHSYTPRTWG